MVALALSVLAFTGSFAAGEAVSPVHADHADGPSFHATATTPSNPALGVTLRTGGETVVRTGFRQQLLGFEGVSFEFSGAPVRATMDFGSPASFSDAPKPLELQFTAPTGLAALDVGLAQRTLSAEYRGVYVTGQGAEVRIGQGLSLMRTDRDSPARTGWYLFAASDGRQLSWTPTSDPSTPNRALRLENGVEVGDLQAGVAMQRGAMQTSLSLVKRTVKTYIGPFKRSADDSFAGVTLTWKH